MTYRNVRSLLKRTFMEVIANTGVNLTTIQSPLFLTAHKSCRTCRARLSLVPSLMWTCLMNEILLSPGNVWPLALMLIGTRPWLCGRNLYHTECTGIRHLNGNKGCQSLCYVTHVKHDTLLPLYMQVKKWTCREFQEQFQFFLPMSNDITLVWEHLWEKVWKVSNDLIFLKDVLFNALTVWTWDFIITMHIRSSWIALEHIYKVIYAIIIIYYQY